MNISDLESETCDLHGGQMLVRITNLRGEPREFVLDPPPFRFARIVWIYDDQGEPTNARWEEAVEV